MGRNLTQQDRITTLKSAPPLPKTGREKVAFVCNDTKTLYLFRREVILKLVDAGYQVTIIAPFDERTEYFLSRSVQFRHLELNRQGRNIIQEIRCYKRILKTYEETKPDIVFQYTIKINIYGTLAAKILGIPCISVVPGLGQFPDENSFIYKYLFAKGYKFAAQNSAETWFLNAHDHGYFEAKGWLKSKKFRILPGEGINTDIFKYKIPNKNKSLKVLFLGRLLETKGAKTFCETAKLSKELNLNISFKMVGFMDESHPNGISSSELNRWIKNGWIEYGGSTKKPHEVLADSDVILVPTKYREGLNRVIQEALAIGRTVITTSVPGAGELIEHLVTGFIVPQDNPEAIINVLQLYLTYPENERLKFGIRGSKSVRNKYSVTKILPNYWDAIKRLCMSD